MGRTKSNLLNQLVKQIGVKFSNCKFKGEHTGVKESAKFRGLDVKSTGFQSDHEPLGGGVQRWPVCLPFKPSTTSIYKLEIDQKAKGINTFYHS